MHALLYSFGRGIIDLGDLDFYGNDPIPTIKGPPLKSKAKRKKTKPDTIPKNKKTVQTIMASFACSTATTTTCTTAITKKVRISSPFFTEIETTTSSSSISVNKATQKGKRKRDESDTIKTSRAKMSSPTNSIPPTSEQRYRGKRKLQVDEDAVNEVSHNATHEKRLQVSNLNTEETPSDRRHPASAITTNNSKRLIGLRLHTAAWLTVSYGADYCITHALSRFGVNKEPMAKAILRVPTMAAHRLFAEPHGAQRVCLSLGAFF